MHLAESLEELDYADRRRGPFKQWISPWIDAEHASQIGSIQEHLQLLCTSRKALIAHGNYLSDLQIELLRSHRQQVAVVYCPRTHQHFRHLEHPARKMAKGQIPLFLGTDSRASNPDLSVFEEWQTASKAFPDLGPKFWMAACTIGPANFLGIENLVGTLRVGSKSLLTWVPLENRPPETEEQLWESILHANRAMPLECHPGFADS
jgi:cytosine/adenosine deaminase-related metal-dependent hydrolase